MTYLEELKHAVEKTHGVKAAHDKTVAVTEVFKGKTVWQGDVEIFLIAGHSKADRCFAWGYQNAKGGWEITTVLEIPPVDSPQTAVKVAIAAHARKVSPRH